MKQAFTLPNLISSLRIPLAFLLLIPNVELRLAVVLCASLTDMLDGFIARKLKQTSRFGVLFDPISDKFFVLMGLGILLNEQKIELWQASTMLTRDFSLLMFGAYVYSTGKRSLYDYGSIWWGKISTSMQLIILLGLTMGYEFPWITYTFFILFGIMAFIELVQRKKEGSTVDSPT